ncbi:cytochrome P450 [Coniochaeta sp. 2T2.1]|nr:cytochrome P450 [Coniochaeta sp. 2T2.1]
MSSTFSIDGVLALVTVNNTLRLFGLWLGYRLLLALYNISPFHPLYNFPGPRLAAASYLYEAWYDLAKAGRYSWEIKAMHEKYGPIVRINPEELHCDDYDFVDDIYPSVANRIRDKHPHFLAAFAGPLTVSTFATRDHETHRIRRSAISKFFSRHSMLRYEPEIHEMAQNMCTKVLRLAESGQIINALDPYNCFTADAISQYCFGEPFGFLDRPDFEQNYKRAFEVLVATSHIFRHIPILRHSVGLMPALGPYLGPDIAYMVKSMHETIPNHVIKAQQQQKSGEGRRVFTEIMDSPIPDEHKTIYRLSGEGWSLVAAGSETTAASLTAITFFLLSQPEKLARLGEELKHEDPQNLSWVRLEKYPYLHGVIFEGFRVALGISGRLPRVARNEDLVYSNRGFHYVVPRGTAIGMNLAFCELYLVTAAMALRVLPHLKLHDTTYEDIRYDFDALTPQPKKGARGVRITGI